MVTNLTTPVENHSDSALLGQAADEFTRRLAAGETPKIEDYAQRYPHIAQMIREVFPALQLMNEHSANGQNRRNLAASAEPPKRLGDFHILREIARGGMGVVYEAQQISLDRRVALKVLPYVGVLDSRQLQRFKNESRAAAGLHHPHIVPIHAVGSERGVHFYAMQYIEGRTLEEVIRELADSEDPNGQSSSPKLFLPRSAADSAAAKPSGNAEPTAEYAGEDPQKPPIDKPVTSPSPDTKPKAALSTQRTISNQQWFRTAAQLAADVALALDHAHHVGVVHRDIKPSNLIVDADGKVWVTDFGLAQMETDAGVTETGDILGTLRYMSPEQAAGDRGVLDHRTDIYSLGATLYELLSMHPAFEGDNRAEVLRKIADEDPPQPRRWNKSVPNDLEVITLKAMAKGPAERYSSAGDLAADLQRFLDHEPIRARRPTLVERSVKWSRRHVVVVWSALILLLLTTLGSAISAVLINRQRAEAVEQRTLANNARKDADDQRDEAEKARRESEESLEFLVSAFRSPDPERDGRTITVAEMLAQAEKQVREEFKNNPRRQAKLLAAIGRTYEGLGRSYDAIATLETACNLARVHLGLNHIVTLAAQRNLGQAYISAGRFVEAVEICEKTFKRIMEILGEEHRDTLASMDKLAVAYQSVGRYQDAISLHQKTLNQRRDVLGPEDRSTLESMNNLAVTYEWAGRYEDAIELHQETLKRRQEILAPDHRETLLSMNNLATAYVSVGRYQDAIDIHQKAYERGKKLFGEDDPRVIRAINELAYAFYRSGRFQDAIDLLQRTRNLRINTLGEQHPDALKSMTLLALAHRGMGRLEKAIELHQQTLQRRKDTLGENHLDTLNSLHNCAATFRHLGRYKEAVDYFAQVINKRKDVLGELHPSTLTSMNSLGVVYFDEGRFKDAIVLFQQIAQQQKQALGEDHPSTLQTLDNLANTYSEIGQIKDAIEMQERSLKKRTVKWGANHPKSLILASNLSNSYVYAGDVEKAIDLQTQVLAQMKKRFGEINPYTLSGVRLLARAYVLTNRFENAVEICRSTLATLRGKSASNERVALEISHFLSAIALARVGQEKYTEAEVLMRECVSIREKKMPNHWALFSAKMTLGEALLGLKRFDEAEHLLTEGYDAIHERSATIPRNGKMVTIRRLERVIKLYEAWNKPVQAAHWQEKWEQAKKSGKPNSQTNAKRGEGNPEPPHSE